MPFQGEAPCRWLHFTGWYQVSTTQLSPNFLLDSTPAASMFSPHQWGDTDLSGPALLLSARVSDPEVHVPGNREVWK